MTQQTELQRQLHDAEQYLRSRIGAANPQLLLVLGSGLGHAADLVEDPVIVPFADVPHLRDASVDAHVGQFVYGMLGDKRALVMQGRLHGYEGYSSQEVAFPVWLAHLLGAGTLFTTNAAGAIAEGLAPGDFCVISDHINFTGRNPTAGNEALGIGPRYFSMEGAYDAKLRETALRVGAEMGVNMHEGVYLGLLGPSLETPAEIRAFALWGASTVAMSVCEEVIAARHVGMRVLGMSLISNYAAGLGPEALDDTLFAHGHESILSSEPEGFAKLVEGIVAAIEL